MNIPLKAEYSLKALLELSLHWPKQGPLAVNIISRQQKIPLKFLTQILLSLKSMGLVESIRGKQGGYILKKNPSKISVLDVLSPYIKGPGKHKSRSMIDQILDESDIQMMGHLAKINFDDIVKRERTSAKAPMYTI